MNLNEFTENRKVRVLEKALNEHYEVQLGIPSMSMKQASSMLSKVKGLLGEARTSKSIHISQSNPAYLKLVMLEQALTLRVSELRSMAKKVVVENEEVQKAQVTLAAQEMVDTVQKMLEQVSKMNIEEMDAVVSGMKNEFGTEVGDSFAQSAGQALSDLQNALQAAKTALTTALGSATGDTPGMEIDSGMGADDMAGDDAGLGDLGAEMPDMGAEDDMDLGGEEVPDDEVSMGNAGRGRR
jgi:hypothetical protein